MDSSVDHSIENRRAARDRETHLTVSAGMLLNAIAPWLSFHIAIVRLYADHADKYFSPVFNTDTEQSTSSRQ